MTSVNVKVKMCGACGRVLGATSQWGDDAAEIERLRAQVARLTRELAAAQPFVERWYPMDSALRDGTHIWGYGPNHGQGLAYYREERDWWFLAGTPGPADLTHWRPLPAPPAEEPR